MIISYEYDRDHAGEWRWIAIASNGRTIGESSEGYENLDDCLDAIAMMRGSSDAVVRHAKPKGLRLMLHPRPSPQSTLAEALRILEGNE
jgi:uncharacterized protein YegP (UPF0339 family)